MDHEKISTFELLMKAYIALRRHPEKVENERKKRWYEFVARRKMTMEEKAAPMGQPLGQVNPQELTNAPILKAAKPNDKKEWSLVSTIPGLLGGSALIWFSSKKGNLWEGAKKSFKDPFSGAAFGDMWKKFLKAATKF